MLNEKGLVIYKNRPALITGREGEKINIALSGGDTFKVREKDVELIHPGPSSLKELDETPPPGNVREAWELLASDTEASGGARLSSLEELAELAYGVFSPRSALAAWELIKEGLYFSGDVKAVRARPAAEVEIEEKKREEKLKEGEERAAFLERLKKVSSQKEGENPLSESDRRFLQDVEALARGQSDKSRTLKELGKAETPEEAHRLLLAAGIWTVWENPHPGRFALSLSSSGIAAPPPPDEERLDLSRLAAFAVDNAWSDDPDDAVSLEGPGDDGLYRLWVHVADPASSVVPDSPADIEARNRGATLYLPEGSFRMLAPELLPFYALGFDTEEAGNGKLSPALSFKMTLNKDLSIADTAIVPSLVKVTRLTYEEADALADRASSSVPGENGQGSVSQSAAPGKILARLFGLADRNIERRVNTGAVLIDLPETRIKLSLGGDKNEVSIEPVIPRRSADMVRECMILAGEGAASWAVKNRLPFPFIGQEEGEFPPEQKRLPGLAGAWQLRRCMRPRLFSVKPSVHWGLGLDQYTQVTSPLRRYTDLLCHQQIRSFLKGEKLLSEEELLFRMGASEAAAAAAAKAERASRSHWLAVYLSDKKDSVWEGVVLDAKGGRAQVIIPALGIETQVKLREKAEPNEKVELVLLSAKIPEAGIIFAAR